MTFTQSLANELPLEPKQSVLLLRRPAPRGRPRVLDRANASGAPASRDDTMFFFYAGGGASGFAFSVAVSLGMMALNGSLPMNLEALAPQLLPFVTFGGLLLSFYAVQQAMSGQFRAAGGAGLGGPPPDADKVFDEVINRVRKLQTEVYYGVRNLSVADLRRRLGDRAKGCLERSELEAAFLEHMDCCPICAEQWADGDIYRVLKCSHCFHIECIDRWALTNARKGKQPTCPLCNTGL